MIGASPRGQQLSLSRDSVARPANVDHLRAPALRLHVGPAMITSASMHRRRARRWLSAAVVLHLGAAAGSAGRAFAAGASLYATQASTHPSGQLTLSSEGAIDWVKWGYPVLPANERGPFAGVDSPHQSASVTRKDLTTPLIGSLVVGHRMDNDQYVRPVPGRLWRYVDGTTLSLSLLFTWSGGTRVLAPGGTSADGIQILGSDLRANWGWGFSFTVQGSTTNVRDLHLYLGCQGDGIYDTGDVTASVGQLTVEPIAICDTALVDKVTITFALGASNEVLTVGVYTGDRDATRQPAITLLAAQLTERPPTGTGGSGGGGGGGGGGGSAQAGSAGGGLAPRRALECNLAPAAGGPGAGVLAALALAAGILRQRRRSP
jgi:hypothetical protein